MDWKQERTVTGKDIARANPTRNICARVYPLCVKGEVIKYRWVIEQGGREVTSSTAENLQAAMNICNAVWETMHSYKEGHL